VTGRQLVVQLERGFGKRVEQPQADRGLERDDEPACGVRRGVVTQLRDRREVGLERIDEAL